MKHRGRIQAQGDNLEQSVSWSQDEPPTVGDGLEMINELKSKLSYADLLLRKNEFEKAENFIKNAGLKGGVDAPVSKSIKVTGTKSSRIDIEVIKGKAFVSIILFIGILFFIFIKG